jgi:hypothetical protein
MQFSQNSLSHYVQVLQNIIVGETEHANSTLGQNSITFFVVHELLQITVLSTISFNGQICLNTEEIKDVSVDWKLSAKSEAVDLMLAENRPEFLFRVGWLLAHFSCEMMKLSATVAAAWHIGPFSTSTPP